MMFAIGEINVVCSDLERSLSFYRDVLGFRFVESDSGAVRLACGARSVLLLPVAGRPVEPQPYCSVPTISLDLYVESIEAAHRHLKANVVTFVREWRPNDKSVHIADPDGLVWEVIEAEKPIDNRFKPAP